MSIEQSAASNPKSLIMVILREAIDLLFSKKKVCPRFGAGYCTLYIRIVALQTLI
jgi:hypothetical protein